MLSHSDFRRLSLAFLALASLGAVVVRHDPRVLAPDIGITAYPGDTVMVQVPYRRDAPQGTVSIWAADREVVHEYPAWPRKYWNNNYYFHSDVPLPDRVAVRVVFSGTRSESVSRTALVTRSSDSGLAGLAAGTRPSESMQKMPQLADLAQQPGRCAPVAAANAMIAMARLHGADDRLPADSGRTIDELSEDMRWTAADGVLPDNFVAGANVWAQKKGLAVRTEKVGTVNGKGTLDALRTAMTAGAVAQLRITFIGASGKSVGGHMTTVSAIASPGVSFVALNDPASATGTDVYRVDNDTIVDYALWHQGPIRVSWGFTHDWREEPH